MARAQSKPRANPALRDPPRTSQRQLVFSANAHAISLRSRLACASSRCRARAPGESAPDDSCHAACVATAGGRRGDYDVATGWQAVAFHSTGVKRTGMRFTPWISVPRWSAGGPVDRSFHALRASLRSRVMPL